MYTRKSRFSAQKRLGSQNTLLLEQLLGPQHRSSASTATLHLFFTRLRTLIAEQMEKASPFAGEAEVDESYFGGVRKGKRGSLVAAEVLFSAGLMLSKWCSL